ncbi:unnamed protein product, partial [Meganyctiphanes norvegica]
MSLQHVCIFSGKMAAAVVLRLLLQVAVFSVTFGREAGLPVISYITEDQEVDPGMDAVLRCRVDPWPNDFPVMWRKAGGAQHDMPISIGSTVIIRDPKYQLWHTSNQYELHIRNAEASDSGDYLCHVYLGIQNYISSRTRLQVRRPPIVLDGSSSSQSIMEGSAGKLECYAEGVPEPSITWLREDRSTLPSGEPQANGNLLLIHAAQTSDHGVYLCVAENMLGRDVRKINLKVNVAAAAASPLVAQAMCTPNCLNGGQCVGTNTCQCPRGFTGPICEKRSFKCNPAAFSPLTTLGVELSSGVECQEGSHWRQDCNWCRCVRGRPHCGRRTCTIEMNAAFANEPECEGDSNWRNSCNWCSCCDSKAVCTVKRCHTDAVNFIPPKQYILMTTRELQG